MYILNKRIVSYVYVCMFGGEGGGPFADFGSCHLVIFKIKLIVSFLTIVKIYYNPYLKN